MISWQIATLLAAAAPAQQPVITGRLRAMLKLAVGLDEVLAEYERLCLVRQFDPAGFKSAVMRSPWRFHRVTGTSPDLIGYDSPKGYASIKWLGPPEGRLPQCNLDSATLGPNRSEATTVRIEARLKRLLGATPPRHASGSSLFWEWPAGEGKVARLYLLREPGSDPRQLKLTLQKWPRVPAYSATDEHGGRR